MLEASRVSFQYKDQPTLADVSLRLHKGETLGIIGPNGSGKSTLLKLLSGIIKPHTGSVTFSNRPIDSLPARLLARRMAVLTQEPLPVIPFTVREIIEMGRYPHRNWFGVEQGDMDALIDSVAESVGIRDMLDRHLSDLSGGERQRVAIAKVMVQQPEVLLLDEPTTFLDIGFQVQTLKWIKNWQRRSNLSVIMVLHDLNMAAMVCDRLILLHQGRIFKEGTPDVVITSETINQVYDVKSMITPHPEHSLPQIWVDLR